MAIQRRLLLILYWIIWPALSLTLLYAVTSISPIFLLPLVVLMTSVHHLALESRCPKCNKPISLNPLKPGSSKEKAIWVWLPYIPKICSYCGLNHSENHGENHDENQDENHNDKVRKNPNI